jgi:predicted Zn-dependent protease
MVSVSLFPLLAGLGDADQGEAARHFREGNGLYDQGHFAGAAADFDRSLREDPQFLEAYYNRALAEEMLDRQKAIEDWKRFVEQAAGHEDLKWDRARAEARIQILETLPAPPAGLLPTHYVEAAGDYYARVATGSEGAQWRSFPLQVFLGSAPQLKWQQGAREAFDLWSAMLAMQIVAMPDRADIRLGWQESVDQAGRAGEEMDWVRTVSAGKQMNSRRVAIITVDLSRNWSKDEMRAIMLHEFGHALGIKGHSDSKKDIMYFELQERYRQIPVPALPTPIFWKSLAKQPSQRDVNTLVRLYNSAGFISRFN